MSALEVRFRIFEEQRRLAAAPRVLSKNPITWMNVARAGNWQLAGIGLEG
jgi:hypothetical protein